MWHQNARWLILAVGLLFIQSLCANGAMPAFFVIMGLYHAWFLIIISLIIEALIFYALIPNISYGKAALMSIIGNAASFIVGVILGARLDNALWDLYPKQYESWLAALANLFGEAVAYLPFLISVPMLLTSILVEAITLRLIFRYTGKQLWIPVIIGNLITYTLHPLYTYFVVQPTWF